MNVPPTAKGGSYDAVSIWILIVLSFRYFFSWRDPSLKGVEYDWLSARNFCRRRCMDSVSLETSLENEWIKQRVVGENVSISVTCGIG